MKFFIILFASVMLFSTTCLAQETAAPARSIAHPRFNEDATRFGWAIVLRVDPIYERNSDDTATHEECDDQVPAAPPPREHSDTRAGGTVVGALVGGVIGNLFGRGDGRKVATAAGVVAGGVIGNNVAAAADARGGQVADSDGPAVERHCRQVADESQRRIAAYDVEYRYGGEVYMARLAYDPGDRMRVRISVIPAD